MVILTLMALAVFVGVAKREGPLIAGTALKDSDDVMRLVQVGDWMDGAGWHDLNQERVNPPAGLDA